MPYIEIVEQFDNPKNPNEIKVILNNGLKIAFNKTIGAEDCYCDIIFNVGSRNETQENSGISHFVEHMVCKGTDVMDSDQFVKMLKINGFSSMSASTGLKNTNYSFNGIADSFYKIFPIVLKFLDNPLFDERLIENERSPIKIERQSGLEKEEENIAIRKGMYPDTSYCYSVIGSEENINKFTRENLINHYNKYYQPCNTSIVISGNFTLENILESIKQSETKFSNCMDCSLRSILEKENKFCISQKLDMMSRFASFKDRKLADSNMVCVSINFPGIDKTHKLYPACIILSRIIGLGNDSRLFKQLRNIDKICYYTASGYSACMTGEYLFDLRANVMLSDLEKCIKSIYYVLKDVLEKGVSEEEVQTCKMQYKRSMILSASGEQSQDSFVFRTTSDNYTLEPRFLISDSIMDVTPADVVDALVLTLEKAPFIIASGDKDKISKYAEKFDEFKLMFVELSSICKNAIADKMNLKNIQNKTLIDDCFDTTKDSSHNMATKISVNR